LGTNIPFHDVPQRPVTHENPHNSGFFCACSGPRRPPSAYGIPPRVGVELGGAGSKRAAGHHGIPPKCPCQTLPSAKPSQPPSRTWRSKDTLHRALTELSCAGIIELTRQGGLNGPSLYACTWVPIDQRKAGLDVSATRVAFGKWSQPMTTPAEAKKTHDCHPDQLSGKSAARDQVSFWTHPRALKLGGDRHSCSIRFNGVEPL
jgi:hypothetical protein